MLSAERQQKIITLCQELLRIKSYSGAEEALVERLKTAFTDLGYDDFFVDGYGNVVGRIKGNKPGKKLLFDGHMDTVPVPEPEQWNFDPFGGELVAGRIYGRGASDMKGALCAMICAAGFFAEDNQREFAGEIYVAGVVHEECFEGIAARRISKEVNPDYVVIGEASRLNLKIGQRGRGEIVVETFGKPAHSANPDKGVNAVYQMILLIEEIRRLPKNYQEPLGEGILELTDIKSYPYPGASVVPDYCRATFDRRLLVGETKEKVLQPIQDIIAKLDAKDSEFKSKVAFAVGEEVCYTGEAITGERFFPAWCYDAEEEFVHQVYEGLKAANLNPEITYYSFCTNGSHYAGEQGIPTIGYGPSEENLAHTVDEYIEVEQLLTGVEGYVAIAKSVLK